MHHHLQQLDPKENLTNLSVLSIFSKRNNKTELTNLSPLAFQFQTTLIRSDAVNDSGPASTSLVLRRPPSCMSSVP